MRCCCATLALLLEKAIPAPTLSVTGTNTIKGDAGASFPGNYLPLFDPGFGRNE
jgi:hypothetical protein